MDITLTTANFELSLKGAEPEEALDTLALLINSGVIPVAEDFEIYEEDEDEDDCCFDFIVDQAKESEYPKYKEFCSGGGECKEASEEEQVNEFLQGLEEILEQVLAASQAEEQKKKEEQEKDTIQEVLSFLFSQAK